MIKFTGKCTVPQPLVDPQIEKFFRENYKNLVKSVSRQARSYTNAEDVVMEAFTRAIKYKDTWDRDQEISAWFNGILGNCLKDFINSLYMNGLVGDVKPEDQDKSYNFDSDYVDHDKVMQLIDTEMGKMADTTRAKCIGLYFKLGMTPKEISEVIPVKRKYVRNTVTRFYKDVQDSYQGV